MKKVYSAWKGYTRSIPFLAHYTIFGTKHNSSIFYRKSAAGRKFSIKYLSRWKFKHFPLVFLLSFVLKNEHEIPGNRFRYPLPPEKSGIMAVYQKGILAVYQNGIMSQAQSPNIPKWYNEPRDVSLYHFFSIYFIIPWYTRSIPFGKVWETTPGGSWNSSMR